MERRLTMKGEYQNRKVWTRILPSNIRALAKREYDKKGGGQR
jgi:hypothetical protein